MGTREFQLLMIFWQLGLVDTFNGMKLCVNGGSQYLSIVVSSAAGNKLSVKTVLEPVLGLLTSYMFVNEISITAFEKRKRIATLASFLSASAGALTTDPTTNGAMGAAIASKIAYMKAVLGLRGGRSPSLKNYLITVSPAQIKFQETNKLIIQNLFQEHTARRYLNGLAQKVKPTAYLVPIGSAQIKTTAVIGLTILGSLSLFQRAERKRSKNHEIIIDVTASPCDEQSNQRLEFSGICYS